MNTNFLVKNTILLISIGLFVSTGCGDIKETNTRTIDSSINTAAPSGDSVKNMNQEKISEAKAAKDQSPATNNSDSESSNSAIKNSAATSPLDCLKSVLTDDELKMAEEYLAGLKGNNTLPVIPKYRLLQNTPMNGDLQKLQIFQKCINDFTDTYKNTPNANIANSNPTIEELIKNISSSMNKTGSLPAEQKPNNPLGEGKR